MTVTIFRLWHTALGHVVTEETVPYPFSLASLPAQICSCGKGVWL